MVFQMRPLIKQSLAIKMSTIYPDIEWYAGISEKKRITARCPNATIHRCPRYFESITLLADAGITTRIRKATHDAVLAKWESHELWPVTGETATSISGGENLNCFSNFCPEVAFDIFKLFASTLIDFSCSLDRENRERQLEREGMPTGKDWRMRWEHIEPMHYSVCPIYSKLPQEKKMSDINFHGPITGQVNVAGESVNSPSLMNLSVGDILTKIESSDASPEQKAAAKSKLSEFLTHPVVAAVVGGLAGG